MATGDAFGQGPGEGGGGRSEDGVDEGDGGQRIGFEIGAGVEAEPAEPEQAGTDIGEDQVVRRDGFLEEGGARPEDQRGDEGGHTGIDVNHGTAGEVIGAHAEQQARTAQTMWAMGM